jgi:hypothetical protein
MCVGSGGPVGEEVRGQARAIRREYLGVLGSRLPPGNGKCLAIQSPVEESSKARRSIFYSGRNQILL